MTQDAESVDTRPEPPPLKVPELPVNEKEPWSDDVLQRREVADRLTRIIEGQEAPFVISVDGRWGTGKTFLLKRWKQNLENQGWQAIYFNAWEDDFSDDPLLAIIGQLSDHLSKGRLRRFLPVLKKFATPLLRQGAPLALSATTGLPPVVLPTPEAGSSPDVFSAYQQRKETTASLKRVLERMSKRVSKQTKQPLVFIIDELDRCRPTFAIELLERVKHIFDVPNIVFVFGINRSELVKALESVYGEIDAGTYLRRFFDMEFVLPEGDAEKFCQGLFEKFKLENFFIKMTHHAKTRVHTDDYREMTFFIPQLCKLMGLSLRDMDYCVRVVALLAKSIRPKHYSHVVLMTALVVLKLDDQDLYRRLVLGECRTKDVVEYIDRKVHGARVLSGQEQTTYDNMETALYATDNAAWSYLREAAWPGQEVSVPAGVFSERAETDDQRLAHLVETAKGFHSLDSESVRYILELVDLFRVGR